MNKKTTSISILSFGHSRYIITAFHEVIYFLSSINIQVEHIGISPDLWYTPESHKCAQAYKEYDCEFHFLPREQGKKTSFWFTPEINKELNRSLPMIARFLYEMVKKYKPDVFIIGDDWGALEVFVMQYFNWKRIPIVFMEHGPAIFNCQLMENVQLKKRMQQDWSNEKYHVPNVNIPGLNADYLICSYSEPSGKMAIKLGVNSACIRNTGFPYFDKIYREKANFLKKKKCERKKILLVSNGRGSFGGQYAESAVEYYKFLITMIRELQPQYDIYLRLKPGEDIKSFLAPKVLQEFNELKFTYDDNAIESYKAIQKYDLMIGEMSTVLLEALIIGIPAVLIHNSNDNFENKRPISNGYFFQNFIDVLTITDSSEMKESVKHALSEDYLRNCCDSLKENERYFFHKLDGKISERVAQVIYEAIVCNLIEKQCITEARELLMDIARKLLFSNELKLIQSKLENTMHVVDLYESEKDPINKISYFQKDETSMAFEVSTSLSSEQYTLSNNLQNIKAEIDIQKNHSEKEKKLLLKIIEISPENLNALNSLASMEINKGNIESAIEFLRDILILDPNNQAALALISNIKTKLLGTKKTYPLHNFHNIPKELRQSYYDHTKDPLSNIDYYRTLKDRLVSLNVTVEEREIDIKDFEQWLNEFPEIKNHYQNHGDVFIEKCLEHYVTYRYLNIAQNDIFIDIAASGSPWAEVLNFRGIRSYRLDMGYPKGLSGINIGADACNSGLHEGFCSALALHCAFECFMGDADIRFAKEASRILNKNGRFAIAPLYLEDTYFVSTSPLCDQKDIIIEKEALKVWRDDEYKVPFDRFYSPESFKQRIYSHIPENMNAKVIYFNNLESLNKYYKGQRIYCFFMLYCEKK